MRNHAVTGVCLCIVYGWGGVCGWVGRARSCILSFCARPLFGEGYFVLSIHARPERILSSIKRPWANCWHRPPYTAMYLPLLHAHPHSHPSPTSPSLPLPLPPCPSPSLQSFFAERFFQLFDRDNSGYISLRELMDGLTLLTNGSESDKLRFLFQVYDVDGKWSSNFSSTILQVEYG